MSRPTARCLALCATAALAVGALGCGGAPPHLDGAPLPPALVLLSGSQLGLRYGATAALRVYYGMVGKPIAGGEVRFAIVGDPAGSTLSSDHARTDPSGQATVVLTAGAGETSYHVVASADNAADAAFDVTVSRLDLAQLRVALAWSGPPAATTLRALLFDGLSCAMLQPGHLPAATHDVGAPGPSATLAFSNLLPRSYALAGRGEDASGRLLGWGCIDLDAALLPPRSQATLPLPLRPAPLTLDHFTLTSAFTPAATVSAPVLTPWQSFGGCANGAAQLLLDGMVAALDPLPLATAIDAQRSPPLGDGCRPGRLDLAVEKLLQGTTGGGPCTLPACKLPALAADLAALVHGATVTSTLRLTAAAGGFTAEHRLVAVTLATAGGSTRIDLGRFGLPLVDAADVAVTLDGDMLTLGAHAFTFGWGALWQAAFTELSLMRLMPATPSVADLVDAVVAAAARGGLTGCAAVADLVCQTVGGACAAEPACESAAAALPATLGAGFAPPTDVDLALDGSALAVDDDGDLAVDRLSGGVWHSPALASGSFTGATP